MQRAIEILQLGFAWTSTRSISTKIAFGVMALLAVFSVAWINQSAKPESLIPILDHRQLNQQEISKVQLALAQEGLNNYEVVETTIRIPRDKRDVYLKAVDKHNAISLPGSQQSNQFNPFLTSKQQVELRIEQKKDRLEQNLMQMQQIEEAMIEYGEVQDDGPFRNKIRMAVVSVKTRQQTHLSQSSIETIRAVTRGTFPGLQDQQIEIIDLENEISYGDSVANSDRQIQRLKAERQRLNLESRVAECLQGFPELRITVSTDESNSAPKSVDSGGNFIVASTDSPNGQIRPKQNRQLVGSNGQVSIRDEQVTQKSGSSFTNTHLSGFERTVLVRPAVVNVAIGVPENYVRKLLENQHQTTGSEFNWNEVQQGFANFRNQLDQVVRSQLPTDQTGNISIILEPGMDAEPSVSAKPFAVTARLWFEQNWKTVVLVVFGMCALLILRPTKNASRNQ